MNENRKLWPEQYANRKVQEHETKIAALESELAAIKAALRAKPRPGRPPKSDAPAKAKSGGKLGINQ